MELRNNWYKADNGKHFVLTEKGKKECASYKHKTVGEPVDEYDYEATEWDVGKSSISNMLDEIDKEPLLEEVLNNGKVIASKAYCDAETKYFMRYQIIKYNKMLYLIEYKEKECVTFEKLQ